MSITKTQEKPIEVALPLDAINVASAQKKSIRYDRDRHPALKGRSGAAPASRGVI